jgi:hypothetical protein
MTRKEIAQALATLPKVGELPYKEWTDEQKNLDNELSCREMINSCLTYGQMNDFYRESTGEWGRWSELHRKNLSDERIIELIAEQRADFEKASVLTNVYTDDEGLSYNAVKWADE